MTKSIEKLTGHLQNRTPQTTKPRACLESLREASKPIEGFQHKCHLTHQSRRFLEPAEEIRRALCVAWSASTVREAPRHPDAGSKSREGDPVQPRRYVIKTLDASTGLGNTRRYCERDRSMFAMRSGRLKRRARLKGQSFPAGSQAVTFGFDGLGRLAASLRV